MAGPGHCPGGDMVMQVRLADCGGALSLERSYWQATQYGACRYVNGLQL